MNHQCKLCTNMLVVCVVGFSILRCVVALGQTETTRPDSNTSIQNAAANSVKNGKLKSEATAHERQVWETRDKMLAGRWVGNLEFGEKMHVLSVTVTTDADRVQRCLRGTYECDGERKKDYHICYGWPMVPATVFEPPLLYQVPKEDFFSGITLYHLNSVIVHERFGKVSGAVVHFELRDDSLKVVLTDEATNKQVARIAVKRQATK